MRWNYCTCLLRIFVDTVLTIPSTLLLTFCAFSSYSSLENYSFVTLGDDWPSMATSEETAVQQQPRPQRRRVNPLKRALRRRALRRSLRREQSLSQKQW